MIVVFKKDADIKEIELLKKSLAKKG
ncbi:MAG: hypothetical protein XD91_1685, partial [Clostridiales bacterium 38_11]